MMLGTARSGLQGAVNGQHLSPLLVNAPLRTSPGRHVSKRQHSMQLQPALISTRDLRTLATPERDVADAADSSAAASTSSSAQQATEAATAASSSSSNSSSNGVSVLTAAEPIDRLRYQALLIFDQVDSDKAGRLTGDQLQKFFTACSRKVSWSPGLSEVLQQVESKFAGLGSSGCSKDEFIRIVRAQVHAVSTSPSYQSSMLRPDVAARLQAQMSVNVQELAAAKWMFGLLDDDNDGKVSLSMYSSAQGIEAYVYEDKIEDADADDDGFITFEEFLVSYAKPKPIFKNLLIMAINTAVIYLILQAPMLDTAIKVVCVGVLLLRPQLVSKPASLLHDAIKAIIDQGRAQAEVAKSNRGIWRPA